MTKLPALAKTDLGAVFPKATLSRAAANAANANGLVRQQGQQQQQQDPQWDIKRQQQQAQSLQM